MLVIGLPRLIRCGAAPGSTVYTLVARAEAASQGSPETERGKLSQLNRGVTGKECGGCNKQVASAPRVDDPSPHSGGGLGGSLSASEVSECRGRTSAGASLDRPPRRGGRAERLNAAVSNLLAVTNVLRGSGHTGRTTSNPFPVATLEGGNTWDPSR